MQKHILTTTLALLLSAGSLWSMTVEERQQYLDHLQQILPVVPSFTNWLDKTRELPPDFDALPRVNSLPDPLTFADGQKVKTPADWQKRRAEIIKLYEMYDIGTIPPKPKLDKIVPVDPATVPSGGGRGFGFGGRGSTPAPGSVTNIVDLQYGPDSKITTRVTLTIPPGDGPFPVLIGGSPGITSRGYIACSMNQSVDPPSAPNIAQYYPGYTFGTMGQTAFTAQMIVDYLYTLPQVDKKCIAITGYSRTGKMAAIAAMLDERITACVAGSTGVGGVLPWRSASERGSGEGIESTTRSFPAWFTPSLRFFTGREDRLPIDGNLLTATIAPRSIISIYGLSDEVGNIYGNEQSYYSAEKVYRLLGVPERNSILHPPGHHGANDLNATMNWLDIQFGRSQATWTNDFLFPWDFDQWRTDNHETVDLRNYPAHRGSEVLGAASSIADWETKAVGIRESVQWMLGNRDGGIGGPDPAQRPRSDVVDWAINRGTSFGWLQPEKSQTEYRSFTFGDGTRAELYYPTGTVANAKLPTVIWLHGFSYPMGYMWVYRQNPDLHPILALVRAGYAVVGFDQTGHGSRTDEFKTFYDRFPHWSRLGRMVADTRAVMDALQKEDMLDTNRIYLYGYSMGGIVAMHTAALDPRVKGVVSICGFTPMRTDPAKTGTGGLARYSVDLPLMPRLGFFLGHEKQLPYDYNELLGVIAPRPVYVVQPLLDRDANPADVKIAVDQARKAYSLYSATNKLVLDEPWDYNRLPEATQDRIIKWMSENMR